MISLFWSSAWWGVGRHESTRKLEIKNSNSDKCKCVNKFVELSTILPVNWHDRHPINNHHSRGMCNIVLAQWQTLNEQIIMKMMMHPFLPFWLLLHKVPTKSCEQNFEGFSEPPVTFGGLRKDPVTRYIVWSFLTRTISRIKCPQVVSMPKFGPTAPDFGYDLWAQNSVSNSLCIQIIHFLNNVLGIWRVWFLLIYQKMF